MVNNSQLSILHTLYSTLNTPMTISETGGLLRIGIKLMMACSTTNVDVYAPPFLKSKRATDGA
jgi:hypothetical protein